MEINDMWSFDQTWSQEKKSDA
jgi:hypothetical protein